MENLLSSLVLISHSSFLCRDHSAFELLRACSVRYGVMNSSSAPSMTRFELGEEDAVVGDAVP